MNCSGLAFTGVPRADLEVREETSGGTKRDVKSFFGGVLV